MKLPMLKKIIRIFSTAFFVMCGLARANEIEFVIVIPSYNNAQWAEDNLRSACFQKSTNPYKVIYVNDCSTDETGKIVENFVQKNQLESLVTIIHNPKRVGPLANWYNTIHEYVDDNKIVVNLDGDDLLFDDTVLMTLEEYYQDKNIWLTYGSALKYPSEIRWRSIREVPRSILEKKKLRSYSFCFQHLRTFKAGLFKKIKKEDLMHEGNFFPCATDYAFMAPMMEMCSPQNKNDVNHSVFIKKILYKYRTNNPISYFQTAKPLQTSMKKIIQQKTPYEPIKSLIGDN